LTEDKEVMDKRSIQIRNGGCKIRKGGSGMRRNARNFYLVCFTTFWVMVVLSFGQPAHGADWPTKDITLIVPYAAGGGYDLVARASAPYIERHLPKKASVVVKNVPGAGGKIGLIEMVRSKPDGHTIAVVDPADVAVLQVGGQLKEVDLVKLSWLGRLDKLPDLLTVGIKTGFKSPSDMKGKTIRFAAIGPGVTFRSAVVAKGIGCEPRFVSYDGTSPASIATMQGDIDAFMVNWVSSMRMVRANEGKLIPMFVAASERVSQNKEVPCSKELGINLEESVLGYSHILVGPPNLPPELKKEWENTLNKIFNDPDWSAQMNKAGYPPSGLAGENLATGVTATLTATGKFKEIISSLGIK
jgi:tripartite-type tricarboxylate transporter receptor subunit TctC